MKKWEEYMMKMKRWLLGVVSFSAVFISACSSGGGRQEGNAAEDDEAINIGSMFELTGSASAYGNTQANAVQMAADEINDDGGIDGQEINIEEYDTQSDEAEAASIATRLATRDNVVAMIGPALTGPMQASIPNANEAQVPLISPSATDDGVLTDEDGNVQPYAYRTGFTNSFQGGALANFANDELDAKKAVILGDNSSDYATGLTDEFTEAFDGEIVSVENFSEGQNDFNAELTNIEQMDFDVLFVPGYYEEGGPIINQAREMGIDQPILGPDGFGNDIIYDLASPENMNDIYHTSHFVLTSDDPDTQDFVSNYRENFDTEPDMFAGLAYDTVYLLKQAIEETGSTNSDDINTGLENIEDFEGITGTFTFDEMHDPIKTVSIIEVQDGEEVGTSEVEPDE